MKYLVIFEKTATGYSAYPPDLPGCGVAGKTLDETKRLIHEAIELHVSGLREDGELIPESTTLADYVTT
jgi:predicted RNase H-like HicB family nuclease